MVSDLHDGVLYSQYGGDPDLADFVEMFVEEMPARVEALLDAFESEDYVAVQRLAHQLKGSSGSYGFDQITPFADRLESSLKDQRDQAQIEADLRELVELCRRVRPGKPSP